jgi:hypothetical protein
VEYPDDLHRVRDDPEKDRVRLCEDGAQPGEKLVARPARLWFLGDASGYPLNRPQYIFGDPR